jgi:2'-hydroxyisoflavone reductase
MRLLVLGGTQFVGRHLVDAARADGHSVTVFTRGRRPLPWTDVEHLRGDRESGDLEALRGREWDACLDVNGYLPQHVRASGALLRDRVAHYLFISTISVYAETSDPIDEASALHAMPAEEVGAVTEDLYGPLKVACEAEAERAFPGRTLILRPGIVAGPFDPTNRYPWWVERIGRGGEVLAPGSAEASVQVVDGRDIALFAARLLDRQATGIFNVCGLPSTFGELLPACRAGTGGGAQLTWVREPILLAEGVEPFDELPLWLPDGPETRAFYSVSNAAARGTGFELRTLAETARDTWEWLRAVRSGDLPALDPAGFLARGLTPEREAALLAAEHAA